MSDYCEDFFVQVTALIYDLKLRITKDAFRSFAIPAVSGVSLLKLLRNLSKQVGCNVYETWKREGCLESVQAVCYLGADFLKSARCLSLR